MATDILTKPRLRTLCILADDLGHSAGDLAFMIKIQPSNFSTEVINPLKNAGYITDSPPLRFEKLKKMRMGDDAKRKEETSYDKLWKDAVNKCKEEGFWSGNPPKRPGRPRKMLYINYDKDETLVSTIKKLASELSEIDNSMRKRRTKINELTQKLKEPKKGNGSETQIEKIESDLDKAKETRTEMEGDRTLYAEALNDLQEKFLFLTLEAEES
jgi:hypothetical protein